MAVPLTSLSHGAGCGCKLSAADLRPIVAGLPRPSDPRVLVATDTADDAGVVQLTEDLAIVQTVDFFTPIVDDPYAFGRIAATNALSDIYAMGGTPVSALNLVAYPLETLGPDVLREILRGGSDAVAAAGASIVGGHSIDDPEPKYGLAVTGIVDPRAILTNAGGRAGDMLVLTKPLGRGDDRHRAEARPGLGGAGRARRRGHDDPERPRRRAGPRGGRARADRRHRLRPARPRPRARRPPPASPPRSTPRAVPAIEGVLDLLSDERAARRRLAPQPRRRRHLHHLVADVADPLRRLCCDAMTSGGLLAAVARTARRDRRLAGRPPRRRAVRFHKRFHKRGLSPSTRLTARYSICITSI